MWHYRCFFFSRNSQKKHFCFFFFLLNFYKLFYRFYFSRVRAQKFIFLCFECNDNIFSLDLSFAFEWKKILRSTSLHLTLTSNHGMKKKQKKLIIVSNLNVRFLFYMLKLKFLYTISPLKKKRFRCFSDQMIHHQIHQSSIQRQSVNLDNEIIH